MDRKSAGDIFATISRDWADWNRAVQSGIPKKRKSWRDSGFLGFGTRLAVACVGSCAAYNPKPF
jgi:hypothetical protein